MKILVNGREAVLKANASFEYVSENPLFTEAEDYTMEIPFPMKDCPQNISIFGPLHVKGVDISKVSFPCEIQTDAFVKSGILTITSVSDTEVKGQFLEGMSQQNFASSLPDVYLTDLDFSQWDGTKGGWENYENSPEFGWEEMVVYDKDREEYLSGRHIYLSHLIKLVAQAIGWHVDISALEAIPMFKYILVANRRVETKWKYSMDTVRSLALSLPYWTIKEFFHQIELFFGCICVLSDSTKTATFCPCSNVLTASSELPIEVSDDFTVEVTKTEEQSSYRGNKKLKFPDECNPDKKNACQQFLDDPKYSKLVKSMELQELYDIIYRASRGKATMPSFISLDLYGLPTSLIYYLPELGEYALVTVTEDVFVKRDEATQEAEHRFQQVDIINQYRSTGEGEELGIAPCPIGHHIVNTDKAVESVVPDIPFDFTGLYTLPRLEFVEPNSNAVFFGASIGSVPKREECLLSGTISASFEGLNWGKIWSDGGVAGRTVMYEMQILIGEKVVASNTYGAILNLTSINGYQRLELQQIGDGPRILDTDIEVPLLSDQAISARVQCIGRNYRDSAPIKCQLWCNNVASRGKIIGAGVIDRSPLLTIPTDPEEEISIGYNGVGYFEPMTALERIGEAKVEEKDKYFKNLWIVLYSAQEGDTKKFAYTKKYEQAVYTVPVSDREGGWLMEDDKVKVHPFSAPFLQFPYTLTPADPSIQSLASLPKVDETKLYRYKFLAKTLPSPTSVFLIKGKRYACLKLTAQITVKGMSELVEGEFYEIID